MKENNLYVGNIQKNCFHDGPGIRTTIFLKGCSLRCPWCANPENLTKRINYIFDKDICNYDKCPYGLDCNGINENNLKLYIDKCPLNAIKVDGKIFSIEKLYNEIKNNFSFDGVTFSGGEPLLQSKSLSLLIKKLKKDNINICIESSMFVDKNNLLDVIDIVDEFIIDLKILDANDCKEYLKGDIEVYLNNIRILSEMNKNFTIRIPAADKYVSNNKNLELIYNFLKKYNPKKVEIFKLHNFAKKKYESLGISFIDNTIISDDELNKIYESIKKLGLAIEILKF